MPVVPEDTTGEASGIVCHKTGKLMIQNIIWRSI